jgi:hypothetical protein
LCRTREPDRLKPKKKKKKKKKKPEWKRNATNIESLSHSQSCDFKWNAVAVTVQNENKRTFEHRWWPRVKHCESGGKLWRTTKPKFTKNTEERNLSLSNAVDEMRWGGWWISLSCVVLHFMMMREEKRWNDTEQ